MVRPRWGVRGALALTLALLATLWAPALAGAEDKIAFTITDSRITASSGLVRNQARDGFWTVNSTDEGGVVYALSDKGEVTGSFRFAASPKDVEALARFGQRLYVADIGDTDEKRDFVTVYYFDRPPTNGSTVQFRSYDFAYPDGAHDAKTLLVDAAGRLYIVTNGKNGAIYAAPGVPSRVALNRLVKIGDAPSYITDGAFTSDNQHLVLRTYVSLIVLNAISYKVEARAATPDQPEGETVSQTLNGKRLLLGSKGNPSTVYSVPVPTEKAADVPKGTATPPGEASASPSASGSDSSDDGSDDSDVGGNSAPTGHGTLLALGLAGAVAVVAGVVVAVVRRP